MAVIPATRFKARCLDLMDRVAERRETYVITKRGKPVAKLVPADRPKRKDIFGCMADQTVFVGELDEPTWSEDQWKELEHQRLEHWRSEERESPKRRTAPTTRTEGRRARLQRKTRPRRSAGKPTR